MNTDAIDRALEALAEADNEYQGYVDAAQTQLDTLSAAIPAITIGEGAGIVFDTIICVNVKIGDLDEILVASLPVYAKHTSEVQVEKFIETWQATAKRNGFNCKINVDTTEIFETTLERLERLKRR